MKFTDRKADFPNRVKLKQIGEDDDGTVYDLKRAEGNIINAGTPLNAATFNQFSQEITESLNSSVKTAGDQAIGGIKNFTGEILNNGERVLPLYRHTISLVGNHIDNINYPFFFNLTFTSTDKTYTQTSFGQFLFNNGYVSPENSINFLHQTLTGNGFMQIGTFYMILFGISVKNDNPANFCVFSQSTTGSYSIMERRVNITSFKIFTK